jgi:hypothetical protein
MASIPHYHAGQFAADWNKNVKPQIYRMSSVKTMSEKARSTLLLSCYQLDRLDFLTQVSGTFVILEDVSNSNYSNSSATNQVVGFCYGACL